MKTITKSDSEAIRDALTLQARDAIAGKRDRVALRALFDTGKEPGDKNAWRIGGAGAWLEDAEDGASFTADQSEPYRVTRDSVEQAMFETLSGLGIVESAS